MRGCGARQQGCDDAGYESDLRGRLRLDTKAQRLPISSSLRMSAHGGILLFLPCLTVVTKRVLSSGMARRSGVMGPEFIRLGPWQCEHFPRIGRLAVVDLRLSVRFIRSADGRNQRDRQRRHGGENRRRSLRDFHQYA